MWVVHSANTGGQKHVRRFELLYTYPAPAALPERLPATKQCSWNSKRRSPKYSRFIGAVKNG